MRLRARHYQTGQRLELVIAHGRLQSLGPVDALEAAHVDAQPVDLEADWIAPAFCDIQINGCDGISFNSEQLTQDQIRHVVHTCRRHGIAQLCPTLITGSFESLRHGLRTVHEACSHDQELRQAVVGIHLEGPYISLEEGPRGAHPRMHVRAPCWDEFQQFQEAAQGRIRIVTIAPELPGAIAFINKLAQTGVLVALGHTAATSACIHAAIQAGARLSTHLGNGSHAMLPRHDNYLWAQMAADELWASMIADGHHLPPELMRCLLRVKTAARMILTCDASPLAGLTPGRYHVWGQDFEVLPIGKIVVQGTSFLAGSWAFTDTCVNKILRLGEIDVATAIHMASNQPRHLLVLPLSRIEVGEPVSYILFDGSPEQPFRLRATLVDDELAKPVPLLV